MSQPAVLRTSSNTRETCLVTVSGDIDLGNSADITDALVDVLNEHAGTIVLDLSAVTYFGVSGLSALANVNELARTNDRRFALGDCSPQVRRVLDLTGTRSMFTFARGADNPRHQEN